MKKRYLLIFAAMFAVCAILLTACGKEEAKPDSENKAPVIDNSDAADDTVGEDIKKDKSPENPDEYPEIPSFYGVFAPDEESVCKLIQENIPAYDKPYDTESKMIPYVSAKELVNGVQIMTIFAQDHGVAVGDITYSPVWIYEHSAEDYKSAGITPQDLRELIDYYSEYKDSEEAKTLAIERMQKLAYAADYSILWYNDHTMMDTGYFPMVMKEFVVVGSLNDLEYYLFLADNDPNDGDDNIYIAMYMKDQLMSVGYDTLEGYDLYGRFFSGSGWGFAYADVAPVPAGSVIRLGWSGTSEQSLQDGFKYLSWISRFQFSGSECAYTQEQLAEYAKRVEAFPFDEEAACVGCEGITQYEDLVNGETFLEGLIPYEPVYDFAKEKAEMIAMLNEKAHVMEDGGCSYTIKYGEGIIETWVECDYALSEEKIYRFKALSDGGENPRYFSNDILESVGYPEEFRSRALINNLGDYALISYGLPKVEGLDYVRLFKLTAIETKESEE